MLTPTSIIGYIVESEGLPEAGLRELFAYVCSSKRAVERAVAIAKERPRGRRRCCFCSSRDACIDLSDIARRSFTDVVTHSLACVCWRCALTVLADKMRRSSLLVALGEHLGVGAPLKKNTLLVGAKSEVRAALPRLRDFGGFYFALLAASARISHLTRFACEQGFAVMHKRRGENKVYYYAEVKVAGAYALVRRRVEFVAPSELAKVDGSCRARHFALRGDEVEARAVRGAVEYVATASAREFAKALLEARGYSLRPA